MLDVAIHGLYMVLEPARLGILMAGVVFGLMLGVIPGMGGVVGLAILIPFTYNLDPYSAFALLLGMAAVTTISDLIPAILFGVPGSVGAAATVMDGHALAKQGQAGRALGAGYSAALIGGIFGALLLAVSLPIIEPVLLYLGSAELFAFCIFGLSMVAVLSGKAPLKGFAAVGVGLMLAMIGSGSQTGTLRWTFGSLYLWDHLPLIPLVLGLFAMPELADMAVSRTTISRVENPDFSLKAQWMGAREALQNWWLVLRCSTLGAILGTIPGLGAASIDWIAYGHTVRSEKNPENFGKGDIRGVIGPQASNNSKEGGHLLPTIAFGVPSGASMAVLLGAFLMHGLVPGPEMLTKHLDLTFSMMWSLTIAHVIGALICLCFSGVFARLAIVKPGRLVPIVLSVMFISAYQGSFSWGDVYSLVIFGFVGWLMKMFSWPRPPLMLGFVLGSLFERYLFITTQTFGAFGWMARPVVIGILLVALWAVYKPLKSCATDTVRLMRTFRLAKVHLTSNIVFSIIVIGLILAALWIARKWPAEAALVPYTAAYVALAFASLNLLTEMFASTSRMPAGHTDTGLIHMDGKADFGDLPQSIALSRALRYFGWLLGFLIVSWLLGLLPAIFLLILLQSRLEFGEPWRFSLIAAGATSLAVWLVFDRIFLLNWPASWIGDMFPDLRAVIRFI